MEEVKEILYNKKTSGFPKGRVRIILESPSATGKGG